MLRTAIVGFSLAVGAAGVLALTLAPETARAAKEKDEKKEKAPTISAKVHKPLTAAQAEMKKEQWDAALARVGEARAVEGRTPFDDFQINEFTWRILINKREFAPAATALEASLNSGFVPPEQTTDRLRQITLLNYEIKNFPKVVEYGKRWVEATGSSDVNALVALGNAQYLTEDYPAAIKTMQSTVSAAQAAGKPVSQEWLQLILSCYAQTDDTAGIAATLEQIAALFPSTENWKKLLDMVYRNADNDDRTTLEIHRLRHELGVIDKVDDYVEMADIAAAVGIPGEAVMAMEKALAVPGGMEAKDKERRAGRLVDLRKTADNDRKSLPELEKEAPASKTGEAYYALGVGYLSFNQFDKATEALKRGVEKGSLKRPDEAQITLGRALLRVNQKDAAKQAFAAVPESSKLARVARLWAIYADQQA